VHYRKRVVRLLVVLPAWNEQESIGTVLDEIRLCLPDAAVLVVDDGSSDDTRSVALASGVPVLTLPYNLGVGGAMRAGFRYAADNAYDALVQIDADGQHDPASVPQLLTALESANIVIGSRFAGEGDYLVHGPRRWAMRLLARSLSRQCKTPLTDVTSGLRMADRRAIELFARTYPAEYLGDTVESLVIAARAGLTVAEVPVSMRLRAHGTPSQSPLKATIYLSRAVLALLLAQIRKRPDVVVPPVPQPLEEPTA
jgi:glycosyltransferase involved in cell wall biosynthesis